MIAIQCVPCDQTIPDYEEFLDHVRAVHPMEWSGATIATAAGRP